MYTVALVCEAVVVKLTESFWKAPPVPGVQVLVPPSTPR
ncbi:hypothetical protein F4556_004708 [Kitasatospora gansuensis]|uniref:Uncharacterized protein n=1 Tax=Kitasatospora gansuensis TaxID=258050 RepID=A0A7W7SEV7_9ACTN|nr:hypothetical protein [Kitasatospora gansuensis]